MNAHIYSDAFCTILRRLPLWLVTATIGEHNNVEVCVPAPNIEQAGLRAGVVLEGSAFAVHSKRFNYHIQSIAQLP